METNAIISTILDEYQKPLGTDFVKYTHHAQRVYALCMMHDRDTGNHDKYAIAAAFHDLGIWTARTFDYLGPSVELAKEWLQRTGREEWTAEIICMINWHHKLSEYKSEYSSTVEIFRRADWTDLSFGLLKYGLSAAGIKQTRKQFPTRGFHRFLVRKTIQNIFRHPLRPLPMFKK